METLKEKVSLIKRYPTEILVLLCLSAIAVLWSKCDDTQKKLDNYIQGDKQVLYEILGRNTLALQENAKALVENTNATNQFVLFNETKRNR